MSEDPTAQSPDSRTAEVLRVLSRAKGDAWQDRSLAGLSVSGRTWGAAGTAGLAVEDDATHRRHGAVPGLDRASPGAGCRRCRREVC